MYDKLFFRFGFLIGYDEAKARLLQVTVVKLKNGKKEEETKIGEARVFLAVILCFLYYI